MLQLAGRPVIETQSKWGFRFRSGEAGILRLGQISNQRATMIKPVNPKLRRSGLCLRVTNKIGLTIPNKHVLRGNARSPSVGPRPGHNENACVRSNDRHT
jgi:hypothetical protein